MNDKLIKATQEIVAENESTAIVSIKNAWIQGYPKEDGIYWFTAVNKKEAPLVAEIKNGRVWCFGHHGSGPMSMFTHPSLAHRMCPHRVLMSHGGGGKSQEKAMRGRKILTDNWRFS